MTRLFEQNWAATKAALEDGMDLMANMSGTPARASSPPQQELTQQRIDELLALRFPEGTSRQVRRAFIRKMRKHQG